MNNQKIRPQSDFGSYGFGAGEGNYDQTYSSSYAMEMI